MSARADEIPVLRLIAVPLGLAALMLRPAGTTAAVVIVALVGAVGLLTPIPQTRQRIVAARWLAATGVGIIAFLVARVFVQAVPAPSSSWGIIAATIAAVAEEAFFRRLLYGWVAAAWSEPLAAVIAAAGFALVHLPAYGLISLPLNFAAGLVLGWQRWASGTWTASAVTHVTANLLQMGGVFIL